MYVNLIRTGETTWPDAKQPLRRARTRSRTPPHAPEAWSHDIGTSAKKMVNVIQVQVQTTPGHSVRPSLRTTRSADAAALGLHVSAL